MTYVPSKPAAVPALGMPLQSALIVEPKSPLLPQAPKDSIVLDGLPGRAGAPFQPLFPSADATRWTDQILYLANLKVSGVPASAQWDLERLVHRIRIVQSYHQIFSQDQAARQKAHCRESDIQEDLSKIPAPAFLKQDRDYASWFLMRYAEDIISLFQIGRSAEATERLSQLGDATLRLQAMGPNNYFLFTRIMVPRIYEEGRGDYFSAFIRAVDAQFKAVERSTVSVNAELSSFTPEESQAWQRVRSALEKLNAALPKNQSTPQQMAGALAKIGIPKDRLLLPDDIRALGSNPNDPRIPPFAYEQKDYFTTPENEMTGRVLISRTPIPRHVLFTIIARYLGDQEGLLVSQVEPLNAVHFSVLRGAQFQLLVSRHLVENASKYGLPPNEVAYETGKFQPRLSANLQSFVDLPEYRLNGSAIFQVLPAMGGRPALPEISLSTARLDPKLTSAKKADEAHYLLNGIWTFRAPPSMLMAYLAKNPKLPQGPALSMGSGDGSEPLYLADSKRPGPKFSGVTAVDHSSIAIDRISRLKDLAGGKPPIEGKIGDAATYKFPPNTYALVTAINLVEFLPAGQRAGFITKVAQSLKSGGQAMLVLDLAEGEGFKEATNEPGATLKGTDLELVYGDIRLKKHFFTEPEVNDLLQKQVKLGPDWEIKFEKIPDSEFACMRIVITRK